MIVSYTIVRVKNSIKIFKIENLLVENLTIEIKNLSYLNFFHHEEIIRGFDYFKFIRKMDEVNDINGDFSIIPDDHPDTNNEFANKVIETKDKIIDKLATAEKSFGYLKYSFILICLIIIGISVYKNVRMLKRLIWLKKSRQRNHGLEAPIGNYSIIELTEKYRDKS